MLGSFDRAETVYSSRGLFALISSLMTGSVPRNSSLSSFAYVAFEAFKPARLTLLSLG